MDELPSFYALKTKEYPPAKDKKGYTKAMDKLESRIKKSGPKFDLSTRAVYYINISKTTPKELMNILGKVVASHGFKNMPSSGNGFKDFFKSFHMYKQISEDVMAICDLSVLYTSNYNTPSYYDKLTFCITAISTSDRNLKKLNLLKEGSELIFIDEGQQAEDYKARKAKEAEDAKKADEERIDRRHWHNNNEEKAYFGYGNKAVKKNPDITHGEVQQAISKSLKNSVGTNDPRVQKQQEKRYQRICDDAIDKGQLPDPDTTKKWAHATLNAHDAAVRHRRRHPDQYKESGIFSDVNLI